MKIGESLKHKFKDSFQYTTFKGRENPSFKNQVNSNFKGSETKIFLDMDDIIIKRIDDSTDEVTFVYEDYKVVGTAKWVKSSLSGYTLTDFI